MSTSFHTGNIVFQLEGLLQHIANEQHECERTFAHYDMNRGIVMLSVTWSERLSMEDLCSYGCIFFQPEVMPLFDVAYKKDYNKIILEYHLPDLTEEAREFVNQQCRALNEMRVYPEVSQVA